MKEEDKGKIKINVSLTNVSSAYGSSRTYIFQSDRGNILRFDQIPFPECCGVAIIKNTSTDSGAPQEDILRCLDMFLDDLSKNDRYSRVLHYNTIGSTISNIMEKHPFVVVGDKFKNTRSGNQLVSFEFNLTKYRLKDRVEPVNIRVIPEELYDHIDTDDLPDHIFDDYNADLISFRDAVQQWADEMDDMEYSELLNRIDPGENGF